MATIEDADILARAVDLILSGDDVEALAVLRTLPSDDPIARPTLGVVVPLQARTVTKGPSPTNAQRYRVYERDGWRCRYCDRKLVVPPVLRLLRVIFPDFKGVTAGHHMPTHDIEPAINRVYPNVDHIHPVSLGGGHDDANLLAACTPHNENKGNRSGWIVRPAQRDGWHGLTESVRALAERAGDLHGDVSWFKALGL